MEATGIRADKSGQRGSVSLFSSSSYSTPSALIVPSYADTTFNAHTSIPPTSPLLSHTFSLNTSTVASGIRN